MTTYNGWTNYETWNVNLWLNNEEQSYLYWEESAIDAWQDAETDENTKNGTWTRSEAARFYMANRLKEEVTLGNPLVGAASMYSDLLGATLSEVNWNEIANSLLEDCDSYESHESKHANT